MRFAAMAVIRAFRHPVQTLQHCSRFCSLQPYREVNETVEEIPVADLLLSTPEGDQQRNNNDTEDSMIPQPSDNHPKQSGSKRIKKTLRGSIKRYGDSCMLSASPVGSTFIARDIQQRISMSNYQYADMREVYVPSYGVFL